MWQNRSIRTPVAAMQEQIMCYWCDCNCNMRALFMGIPRHISHYWAYLSTYDWIQMIIVNKLTVVGPNCIFSSRAIQSSSSREEIGLFLALLAEGERHANILLCLGMNSGRKFHPQGDQFASIVEFFRGKIRNPAQICCWLPFVKVWWTTCYCITVFSSYHIQKHLLLVHHFSNQKQNSHLPLKIHLGGIFWKHWNIQFLPIPQVRYFFHALFLPPAHLTNEIIFIRCRPGCWHQIQKPCS